MPSGEVGGVRGIDDVVRAFEQAGLTVQKQKTDVLKAAGESVRQDAETLAIVNIPRIGFRWSRMRIGVTKQMVYVAPKSRSTRLLLAKRPNLADKLRLQAMNPAVVRNEGEVVRRLKELLAKVESEFKRGS